MEQIRIAVVLTDEALRNRVAQVFDRAPANWRVALFDVPPPGADVTVSTDPRADVPIDPARLDQVVPAIEARLRANRQTRVISVVGATGGCGTTTVALHLARALGRRRSVACVETDPSRRSFAARLGMREDARTWGAEDLANDISFPGLPVEGLRVFMAPPTGPGDADLSGSLSGRFDIVVQEPHLASAPDAGVLVVPPTPAGARRAAAIAAQLPDIPWAIVANRTAPGESLSSDALGEVIGAPPTLMLGFSPSVRRAELHGRLATRWSGFSRAIDRLATCMEGSV